MDPLPRRRRPVLRGARAGAILAPLSLASACAVAVGLGAASVVGCGPPPLGPVGTSSAGRGGPRAQGPSSASATPRAPGPYAAGFESAYARVSPRAPSRGHGTAGYTVEVFANAEAAPAWATDHAPFAAGARLVAVHTVRSREGEARGPVYLMEKQADGWRYAVASADGHVALGAALDACARCHDDAPHDGVFRADR